MLMRFVLTFVEGGGAPRALQEGVQVQEQLVPAGRGVAVPGEAGHQTLNSDSQLVLRGSLGAFVPDPTLVEVRPSARHHV